VETRTKTNAANRKIAPPAKADGKRSTHLPRPDAGHTAEPGQRAGVQSLGRAFAILEGVARHREGIGLADLMHALKARAKALQAAADQLSRDFGAQGAAGVAAPPGT
jgi:hypothetical protein